MIRILVYLEFDDTATFSSSFYSRQVNLVEMNQQAV